MLEMRVACVLSPKTHYTFKRMNKRTNWRLIDEIEARDAAQNMARDEIALWQMRASDAPLLRFYRWNPACLSLGRFQKIGSIPPNDGEFGRDIVRRPTGGRAVWHQHEITYSVVLHEELLPANERSVTASYARISDGFLRGLQLLGIEAQIAPAAPNVVTPNIAAPFGATMNEPKSHTSSTRSLDAATADTVTVSTENSLQNAAAPKTAAFKTAAPKTEISPNCFESATRADFVVDGRKILGAAQCRHGGAILQHGSLLLDADLSSWRARAGGNLSRVVTLKTLGTEASRDEIIAALCAGIAASWNATLQKSDWSRAENAIATRLADEKYRRATWNRDAQEIPAASIQEICALSNSN